MAAINTISMLDTEHSGGLISIFDAQSTVVLLFALNVFVFVSTLSNWDFNKNWLQFGMFWLLVNASKKTMGVSQCWESFIFSQAFSCKHLHLNTTIPRCLARRMLLFLL